jgi:hypothetical protein
MVVVDVQMKIESTYYMLLMVLLAIIFSSYIFLYNVGFKFKMVLITVFFIIEISLYYLYVLKQREEEKISSNTGWPPTDYSTNIGNKCPTHWINTTSSDPDTAICENTYNIGVNGADERKKEYNEAADAADAAAAAVVTAAAAANANPTSDSDAADAAAAVTAAASAAATKADAFAKICYDTELDANEQITEIKNTKTFNKIDGASAKCNWINNCGSAAGISASWMGMSEQC